MPFLYEKECTTAVLISMYQCSIRNFIKLNPNQIYILCSMGSLS